MLNQCVIIQIVTYTDHQSTKNAKKKVIEIIRKRGGKKLVSKNIEKGLGHKSPVCECTTQNTSVYTLIIIIIIRRGRRSGGSRDRTFGGSLGRLLFSYDSISEKPQTHEHREQ